MGSLFNEYLIKKIFNYYLESSVILSTKIKRKNHLIENLSDNNYKIYKNYTTDASLCNSCFAISNLKPLKCLLCNKESRQCYDSQVYRYLKKRYPTIVCDQYDMCDFFIHEQQCECLGKSSGECLLKKRLLENSLLKKLSTDDNPNCKNNKQHYQYILCKDCMSYYSRGSVIDELENLCTANCKECDTAIEKLIENHIAVSKNIKLLSCDYSKPIPNVPNVHNIHNVQSLIEAVSGLIIDFDEELNMWIEYLHEINYINYENNCNDYRRSLCHGCGICLPNNYMGVECFFCNRYYCRSDDYYDPKDCCSTMAINSNELNIKKRKCDNILRKNSYVTEVCEGTDRGRYSWGCGVNLNVCNTCISYIRYGVYLACVDSCDWRCSKCAEDIQRAVNAKVCEIIDENKKY